MEKYIFDLQLFADDPESGSGADTGGSEGTDVEKHDEQQKDADKPKYTDADVDALINKKFAEWQKKQEKQVSEAERLGQMSAEEKANARMKALEDKLHEYEVNAARSEMTKQARAILSDKGIHASDELIANLIAEDAETTKKSVESFVTLFNAAVESAVKAALKTEVPKKGGSTGMTKEQIMAVTNRAERQRLIKENMNLFT
jgi:hypothetical protein